MRGQSQACLVAVLLSTSSLMACAVEDSEGSANDPSDVDPGTIAPLAADLPAAVPCATTPIDAWIGPAGRINENYPDNVAVTVTWQRVASSGCVDHYEPSGTARYAYAIPGALCAQSLDPRDTAIRATDGSLTIDRSTSPATFVGHGSTTWAVTWTCIEDDGTTNTTPFDGGGVWFDASGSIAGPRIEGTRTEEDGRLCGQGGSSLPCEYSWAFDAVE